MPRPLRVFLCHASQDKPSVWKLHRYLKQHGVKPWLDQEDLLPGEDWEVEIPKALFASDVILVCLSKNSVNKEGFVQKEITFALDKAMEKPEGTIFIIPVKLEDCEIPRRLTRYQWVDLSRADGRKRLLMGLNKRVTELGPDVSPAILDETRKTLTPRTPKPESKKPEEPIPFSPRKKGRDEGESREEPKKETPVKPFTKLLDPSSLSPKGKVQGKGRPAPRGEKRKLVVKTNPMEVEDSKPAKPKNSIWAIGYSSLVIISILLWGIYSVSPQIKTPTQMPTDLPIATATIVPTQTPSVTPSPIENAPFVPISSTPFDAKIAVTWDSAVGSLFAQKCLICHGATASGGLILSTYPDAMKGGASGAVFTPGDSTNSLMIVKLESGKHRYSVFSPEELILIKTWIEAGALEK